MRKPQGYRKNRKLRITASFDPEQFDEIGRFAEQEELTFGEAVRLLCEWGLEHNSVGINRKETPLHPPAG